MNYGISIGNKDLKQYQKHRRKCFKSYGNREVIREITLFCEKICQYKTSDFSNRTKQDSYGFVECKTNKQLQSLGYKILQEAIKLGFDREWLNI